MTLPPPATPPTTVPAPDGLTAPAAQLGAHAAALHAHAERLHASAAALDWSGPEAAAFHHHVEQLAHRCTAAAHALTHSATLLALLLTESNPVAGVLEHPPRRSRGAWIGRPG